MREFLSMPPIGGGEISNKSGFSKHRPANGSKAKGEEQSPAKAEAHVQDGR